MGSNNYLLTMFLYIGRFLFLIALHTMLQLHTVDTYIYNLLLSPFTPSKTVPINVLSYYL